MWPLLEVLLVFLSILQSFSPLVGKAGGLFLILELPLDHPDEASQRSDYSADSVRDETNSSASSEHGDEESRPSLSQHQTKRDTTANDHDRQPEVTSSAAEMSDKPTTEQDPQIASHSAETFVDSAEQTQKTNDANATVTRANANITPPNTTAALEDQSPKRDEELWYEDGNLILIAEGIEFRIYKGPVIAQSLVFKDMLSLPQPSSSDGPSPRNASLPSCAIVHLHGDSLSDLRHFLPMFIGHTISFGGLSDPTYHQLSSIIRLAHKYQCEKLLERCVAYLKRFYHDSFEGWRDNSTCISPPNFERVHAIGVVNLARLLGQDKMLPGALMACCLLDAEIARGFEREDGARETLSTEDLGRCIVGRTKLLEANVQATLKILRPDVHEDCMRRDVCGAVLLNLLKKLDEGTVLYSFRWDWTWTAYVEWADAQRELCPRCFDMLGKGGRQKDQHFEIFNRLPDLMGVKVNHWGKTQAEIEALVQAQDVADD